MPQLDDPKKIADRLCGKKVDEITPAAGGANNRIYKVSVGSIDYALKFYPQQKNDPRDRLGTEFTSLVFLSENGIRDIPIPIARDQNNQCALYSWIDGEPTSQASMSDIEPFADFFLKIQQLRDCPGAKGLEPASAACLAPSDAAEQLGHRLSTLKQRAVPSPELTAFLSTKLEPAINRAVTRSKKNLNELEHGRLGYQRLALSPSDFGLHNALKRSDGGYSFLDFEYFGWDDPVKAIADVMLHPGHALNDSNRALFYGKAAPYFSQLDTEFEPRFKALFPIYGLIWCLIILNDFLPDRWQRRQLAGESRAWQDFQLHQLAKAGQLLNSLQDEGGTHVGI